MPRDYYSIAKERIHQNLIYRTFYQEFDRHGKLPILSIVYCPPVPSPSGYGLFYPVTYRRQPYGFKTCLLEKGFHTL